MVNQLPDLVHYLNADYQLTGLSREGFPVAQTFGVQPEAVVENCRRGYVMRYQVLNNRLFVQEMTVWAREYPLISGRAPEATQDVQLRGAQTYRLKLPQTYDGGVLIGRDLSEFAIYPTGRPAPHSFSTIIELIFENGLLVASINHSQAVRDLYARFEKQINDKLADYQQNKHDDLRIYLSPYLSTSDVLTIDKIYGDPLRWDEATNTIKPHALATIIHAFVGGLWKLTYPPLS